MATHTRIRPFNTKDTYPEQNLDNDLCQAVVAGGVVYLRGQIGQDLDTRESVGIGDVAAQTEKAMSNIAMLLDEAGSSLEDIVKVTVYLTDIRYRETVYRIMGRWLKGVYPVSTGLVVEALARPEWLVEIDATAVISEVDGTPTNDVLPRRPRRRHGRLRHRDLFVEPRGRVALCTHPGDRRGGRVAERHQPGARPTACSTRSPAVPMPTQHSKPHWHTSNSPTTGN